MRESIGSAWLYGLVLTFILLFTAFLSLAIRYSKVFKMKNEVLSIIEKYEGFNENSRKIINDYLKVTGYSSMGYCPNDDVTTSYYGVDNYSVTGRVVNDASSNKKYYYCIKRNSENGIITYDVVLFFKFELPLFGDIGSFKINGRTKSISYDYSFWSIN